MNSGLELLIVDLDDDLVDVRVTASNGAFQGSVRAYVSLDGLRELASAIDGFPRDATDAQTIELGATSSRFAGGGVQLKLSCQDRAAHPQVQVTLRSDDRLRGEEHATFPIALEAASIDAFVEQLRTMPMVVGSRAELRGAA